MDRIVVNTGDVNLLLALMHELGDAFFCKRGKIYKVAYFAQHRQVLFEGQLTDKQVKEVQGQAHKVKDITIDEFHDTLVITD